MNTPAFPHSNSLARPIGIGGTDIGAILGLSPYKTPLELWSELVSGDSPAHRDLLHLRYGQHTESFVAREYERVSQLFTVKHEPTLFHKTYGYIFGLVDRFVLDTPTLETRALSTVKGQKSGESAPWFKLLVEKNTLHLQLPRKFTQTA